MRLPGFERVACYPTAAEAEVVRGLLAASAIDARLAGTNHLAREHFPGGDLAVLVPEAEVARAREIIASAREPDGEEPAPAARRSRPASGLARAALAVGLALLAGGVLLSRAPPAREVSYAILVAGAVLAAAGALAGRAGRRAPVRSLD